MLLYTVFEILRGAIGRLIDGGQPEVTPISFVVMLVTIAINLVVANWERRQGRRLKSDVLVADATQTRSDIFVSLAVIGSLVAAELGYPQVDALVALAVAGLVGHAAWQVLSRASAVLSDEAALPGDELDRVARSVAGVEGTHRVWTRGRQDEVYVDLDIRVDAGLTVEQGHTLAHEVRERIRQRWPGVRHIMVHVEPVVPADATAIQRIHHLARQRNLNVHDVRVRETPAGQEAAFHLEVDPALTLGEAHALADELELAIQADLPPIQAVTSHIEGATGAVESHEDVTDTSPGLVAHVERIADVAVGRGRCHAVRVYRNGQGDTATYDLVMHCTLPEALPLAEAHERAEQVERALRAAMPDLGAVTVHAEPPEER
jgi:cation diffusion facilitator family transporter